MALSPEDDLMQSLTSGQLFSSHPLPENDPFTPLLARYLPHQARPQRKTDQAGADDTTASLIVCLSRSSDYLPHTITLIVLPQARQRWQALANRIGDEILERRGSRNNSLQDVEAVLSKWTIRLQCLRRLQRLHVLASEATALFGSLPPLYTLPQHPKTHIDAPIFETYIPFELILLQAVLPTYLRGDQHMVLQHLQEIAYACKLEYRRTHDAVWVKRLQTTAMAIVNVLYAIGEAQQAMDLLQSLAQQQQKQDAQQLGDLCMLALDIGDMNTAESLLKKLRDVSQTSEECQSLEVAKLLCEGQWSSAEEAARTWSTSASSSITAKVNLAACCMYTDTVEEVCMIRVDVSGQADFKTILHQGIEILEALARTEPERFYNSETNISNLVALQELRAGDQTANKLDLLKECSRYASESLSLDCLRL